MVLALIASTTGLTKQQILSSVYGYSDRYDESGNNASLERQFERDKDSLRELGIPLDTIDSPEEAGNTQLMRYRILKEGYELPADVSFDARERALLALASTVWREGSLSAESRRSLMKLTSLGVTPDSALIGYSPRVHTRDAAFPALLEAIQQRHTVSFQYAKPGIPAVFTREVVPLALVSFESRWHLYSYDWAMHAPRTFLLSRMVSPVSQVSAPDYNYDDSFDYAGHLFSELQAIADRQHATVRVLRNTDAAVRLAERAAKASEGDSPVGIDDSTALITLSVPYVDAHVFADELAGYGPEATVIEPAELRDLVIRRLRRAVSAHG
nr:WYL domain-containing protein [Lysinibacter cavernae]